MLQELNTVLGQRSKEREQRQLAKKGQTLPTTQSDETSDTCSDGDDKNKQDKTQSSKTQNPSDNVDKDVTIQGHVQAGDNSQELGGDCGAGDSFANVQGNARSTCNFRTSDNGDGKTIKEESDEALPSHQPSVLSHQPFGLPRPGVPFMTSVAAQAVMKSRLQGGLTEETFGQEDSSPEEEG